MERITLRYWAGLKEAAGVAEEQVAASTLHEALAQARERHGERFAQVLERCTLLVDGTRASGDLALADGAEVDCLPPYAGG